MAYAVTQACCNDASCVSVCPVNCIHPTPEEREFGSTEMVHIDPRICIDCGACADACPVDAVKPIDLLRGPEEAYAALNAAWYDGTEPQEWGPPHFPAAPPAGARDLRVAVVGTGPSAGYAAQALVTAGVRVTMVERLSEAGGLIRFGVAPDHPGTRRIGSRFAALREHPRVKTRLGVEVGRDVTHQQLLRDHDAVLYAVGASDHRRLDVPGEELPGVVPARRLVGWYNGHPDAPRSVPLGTERAVVAGVGNVALDVARVLLTDPDRLAGTDIARPALAALRDSRIREVVLLGRRGPEHAAYSNSEMLELEHHPDLDVVRTEEPLADLPPAERPRVVLAFSSTLAAIEGEGRAERVRLVRPSGPETLEAGLVVPAIGFRGAPVPGLPFDDATGTVPHEAGRVVGGAAERAYVVGWIKRGPSGGIGANRQCAEETVATLLADVAALSARR
ncbi:FAD-dependent oxidoreductase [Nocardioides pantholopis]|uniref:FAD-dependent oxidoreductase n=1 Tax=Nocardioides pantholopis TaxID=2483798 RepID=UPI000FDBC467|nr:FAD-dependent oxidoreductase [Nocardioides pantholopis]